MRVACCLLALALAYTPHLHAAMASDDLAKLVQQAGAHDNAGGAGGLMNFLAQGLQKVATFGKNRHALREWEELLNDIQDQIAKLRSDEARNVFLTTLPRLPPQGQVIVLMGLKEHPSHSDIGMAVEKILKSARDFQVQVACMEVLGAQTYSEAAPAVAKMLKPTHLVSVQIAACRALARMKSPAGVDPLIEHLSKWKSSRMRYEAVAALRALTGQEFNADPSTWTGWWTKNKDGFKPEQSVEPAFNYELQPNKEDGEDLSYYELPILENRIVFIIDTSGSMQLGGTPNRLDKSITELKNLIARLPERVLFNIILFSNNVRRWQQQAALVPANDANKKMAQAFLDEARPGGGTMTMDTMEEALREVALMNGVETVFLLTDGQPQPMRHSNVTTVAMLPKGNQAIRRRIKFINQTLLVRIHTIGVYTRAAGDQKEPGNATDMEAFLQGIAADNDGQYRKVD